MKPVGVQLWHNIHNKTYAGIRKRTHHNDSSRVHQMLARVFLAVQHGGVMSVVLQQMEFTL